MKIRGIFLKEYVKIVNHTRDKDWERFLTEEDWKICSEMIIPTAWYPANTMGRIAKGLYELLTGRSTVFIRAHGRAQAPVYFEDAKNFLLKDDIGQALPNFVMIVDRYIDEIKVTLEEVADNHALVSWYPVEGAMSFELYREVMAGDLEWVIEANGGKDPVAEFIEETRDGREALIIKVKWG